MRTLLILGGLVVCVLLVTPSNGDRTECQDGGEKSMDSGDLTVPAEPSEIPIIETTTKRPCCGWPRREPCKVCSGGGSGIGSVDPLAIYQKLMVSRRLKVPAEPSESNVEQLPCCGWPIKPPCKKCPGKYTAIGHKPGIDQKLMVSRRLTVPAEPSERNVEQLPCCEWPNIENCQYCPGGPSAIGSAIDEKLMDSEDLTVPAEPSKIPIMETTKKLPCCGWPRRVPCKVCPRWGPDIDDER